MTADRTISDVDLKPAPSNVSDMEQTWPAPAENAKRTIALKLTVIARQLWRQFDQGVDGIGVSRAKWRLIAAVSRRPGATQRLIAEVLEVSEVTAGRLIERLCADGYLERREDRNDRRAHRIYLTPTAQPLLDRLGELASLCEEEAFAGIGEKDLSQLGALLDVVSRNVARTPLVQPPDPGQDNWP